ncbi:MAG: 4-aminobutyrate--2-oxoglutarate transaminase [Acidobacteria bacterium]|nr:4-aminobutyrate--2-oxoglutarate transaminase [Acidobacteriota bacterium]MBS1864877.1 4-aminobutyrate--2-oxoglutarate transaminase [Acidobacteriota bacterium]
MRRRLAGTEIRSGRITTMGTIQIRTAIPGPKSKALMDRRNAAVARGPFHATPVFAAKADGAVIEDVDGNRFIDFAGGIGCLNIGHRDARVLEAVRKQMERYLHVCFSVTPYESYIAVAEKLNALTPGKFPKKTVLVNSGAEAVENAIKIARAYTKRPAVICFEDAFHGRTLMAMSLTSKPHPYKAGFEPMASDVYRIPYAYQYRSEAGATAEEFAHHLEDAFKRHVAAENVAAVIAEPVLGEGGFVVPPRDYFAALHKICKKHGILFIADEVQSGIARTGRWFASEYFGIEPDLLISAKSLGGGMPLAAVTGRAEVMDAPGVGGLGGTFGGNPLSCAAALAALETVEKDGLLARSTEVGRKFEARAREWQKKWEMVGEVRGLGGMCAIELVRDARTKEPADAETKELSKYCYEHGLITITAGTYGNVMRILVPLVVTDAQLEEGMDVLEAGLATVAEKKQLTQAAV